MGYNMNKDTKRRLVKIVSDMLMLMEDVDNKAYEFITVLDKYGMERDDYIYDFIDMIKDGGVSHDAEEAVDEFLVNLE